MEIVGPHISRVDSIVNNLATVKANSDGLVSAVNKKILDAEEKTDVRVKPNQTNKLTNDQATQTKRQLHKDAIMMVAVHRGMP